MLALGHRMQWLFLFSLGDLLLPDEASYTTPCAFAVGWNDWIPEGFSFLVSFIQRSRPQKDFLHNVIVIIIIKTSGLGLGSGS